MPQHAEDSLSVAAELLAQSYHELYHITLTSVSLVYYYTSHPYYFLFKIEIEIEIERKRERGERTLFF